MTLTRQFQNRNFEVITVSIDTADNEPKALEFLQKQHAALPNRIKRVVAGEGRSTDNYLFTGKVDVLQGVLDAQWEGPVPYTLIVAPGGKIIYRHLGAFDIADVRSKLVDALGPYYNQQTNN